MFEASNGVGVMLHVDGSLLFRGSRNDTQTTEAAREYFQWERDQELGRWRDPENPDRYIPHASLGPRPGRGERRWVKVYDEKQNTSEEIAEDYYCAGMGSWWDTAYRYFAAHPEKQPWHDAQPGEVWAITIRGEERLYRCGASGLYSIEHGAHLSDTAPQHVTAGRRIWPEEKGEEDE